MGRALRRVVVGLLIAAGLLSGCRSDRSDDASKADPESLAVGFRIGVGGPVRLDRWNVVRLELANPGEDFRGTVEIAGVGYDPSGNLSEDNVTYRVETEIPSGSTRELLVPVRIGSWTQIEIVLRGVSKRLRIVHDFPISSSDFRVLAVADRPATLGALSKWITETWLKEGGGARRQTRPDLMFAVTDRCEVVSVGPQDLLNLAPAYDSFDLILLQGTTLTNAPAGTTDALTRWVEGGGNLVAFPGAGWGVGLPEAFRELLSVKLGDPQASAPVTFLSGIRSRLRDGISYRQVLPVGAGRAVADGVAVTARRGAGQTTAFSVNVGGEVFPDPDEAEAFYDLLRPGVERPFGRPGLVKQVVSTMEYQAAPALFQLSGYLVPSRLAVTFALFVYLAVGFFLPAYFFKRLNRREWTFVVVLVAAGLATAGIWKLGLLSARRVLELEEISVVRVHADGKAAEVTSFVGIMSPALDRVSLLPDDDDPDRVVGAMTHPLRSGRLYYGGPRTPEPDTTIDATVDGSLHLPPVQVYPNALRAFRCDYTVESAPFLDIEPSADSVTFNNRTSKTIETYFVRGDEYQRYGDLEAGKSMSIRGDDLASGWTRSSSASNVNFYPGSRFTASQFVEAAFLSPRKFIERLQGQVGPRFGSASLTGRSSRSTGATSISFVGIVAESVFPAHRDFGARRAQSVVTWEMPEL